MNISKLSMCLLVALSLQVKADNHCYDYPDDEDCKEKVVDILDLFGGNDNDNSQYPDGTLEERNYNLFKDEGDHFKELVVEGKFISASMLFDKYEDSYFTKEAFFGGEVPVDKLSKEINEVVHALQEKLLPGILENISIINKNRSLVKNSDKSLSYKWQEFSRLIEKANQMYEDYKSYRIIALPGKDKQKKDVELLSVIKAFKQELKDNAPKELDRYDFSSGKDFFEAYPVKLNKSKVVSSSSKTVLKWLEEASPDEAINLINKYNLNSSIHIKNKLAGILLDKASRITYGNEQPPLMDVLDTLKQIQGLGINIEMSEIPMRYRTIFFQPQKPNDFSDVNNILEGRESYVVVIDTRKIDIKHDSAELNKINSTYISSRSMVSNPDYEFARNGYNLVLQQYNSAAQKYQNALDEQQRSRLEYQREQDRRRLAAGSRTNCSSFDGYSINCRTTPGFVGFVPDYSDTLGGIAPAIAKREVDQFRTLLYQAESNLNSVPKEIEKLNYKEYSFTTKTYNLVKNYKYVVYLINRVSKEYSVVDISLSKEKKFVVANNIHIEDPNHNSTDYSTLDDMKIFISGQDDFSLEEIMNQVPREYSLTRYSSLKKLLADIKSSYKEPDLQATSKLIVVDDGKSLHTNETGPDYIQDLERIKALLDSGVITKDDYITLKQKIINKL